ncbi:hypothetical protein BJ165DRAFT_1404515 [Panaeolus papilionaceus]|nr:hypothetical protein BJ165DRAFT_1404515 [Panaeolus papilionaceus]
MWIGCEAGILDRIFVVPGGRFLLGQSHWETGMIDWEGDVADSHPGVFSEWDTRARRGTSFLAHLYEEDKIRIIISEKMGDKLLAVYGDTWPSGSCSSTMGYGSITSHQEILSLLFWLVQAGKSVKKGLKSEKPGSRKARVLFAKSGGFFPKTNQIWLTCPAADMGYIDPNASYALSEEDLVIVLNRDGQRRCYMRNFDTNIVRTWTIDSLKGLGESKIIIDNTRNVIFLIDLGFVQAWKIPVFESEDSDAVGAVNAHIDNSVVLRMTFAIPQARSSKPRSSSWILQGNASSTEEILHFEPHRVMSGYIFKTWYFEDMVYLQMCEYQLRYAELLTAFDITKESDPVQLEAMKLSKIPATDEEKDLSDGLKAFFPDDGSWRFPSDVSKFSFDPFSCHLTFVKGDGVWTKLFGFGHPPLKSARALQYTDPSKESPLPVYVYPAYTVDLIIFVT